MTILQKTFSVVVATIIVSGSLYSWPGFILLGETFPLFEYDTDRDQDGIDDQRDILAGAKQDVGRTVFYDPSYFEKGYPPDTRGVCADVIWRSFQVAGYDLKGMIDEDIAKHPSDYSFESTSPDPNIDFRRVKNLFVFFSKYAQSLSVEVKLGDKENLSQWQGGDIVIFAPSWISSGMHIAIVSDKRTWRGVPYLIHNYRSGTKENNLLTLWPTPIVGHFRFSK